MILIDTNLLIYAINQDSPHHEKARPWLEKVLSGSATIGLAWIVILAFLRITTRSGVMRKQIPPDRAIAILDSWLSQPHVALVHPGEKHWHILRNLVIATGTSGNLTTDAHIAALAIEQGYAVYTMDNDFRRFAGLTVVNPLAS